MCWNFLDKILQGKTKISNIKGSVEGYFIDFFFMYNPPTSRTPAALAAPAAPTVLTVPATSEALAGQESQRLQGLKRRLLLGVGVPNS